MENTPPTDIYTQNLDDLFIAEKKYQDLHREANGYSPEDIQKNRPWGLAISGGGVRSATLGLGLLQGLIGKNKPEGLDAEDERIFDYDNKKILRRIDYLSTVSGGGYIGSCLSSLLSDPEKKKTAIAGGVTLGVVPENSPFVGLNIKTSQEYFPPEKTVLNIRNQVHHLRSHGEYLRSREGFFGRDTLRMIGTLFSGLFHNMLLFLVVLIAAVAFHGMLLYLFSGGAFFEYTDRPTVSPADYESSAEYIFAVMGSWVETAFVVPLGNIIMALKEIPLIGVGFFLVGIVAGIIFITRGISLYGKILKERDLWNWTNGPKKFPSGYNAEDFFESRFMSWFNPVALLGGPALGIVLGFLCPVYHWNYWMIFGTPFLFSLGLCMTTYMVIPFSSLHQRSGARVLRSVFGSLQGGALFGLVLTAVMPFVIIFLFSTRINMNFISALVTVAAGYFFLKKSTADTDKKPGIMTKIMKMLQYPLLNLSVILLFILAFSFLSNIIFPLHPQFDDRFFLVGPYYFDWVGIVILWICILTVFVIGIKINSNHLSPHNFYRDRLSEAYLKTDSSVRRENEHYPGMPLATIRNDEELLLKDLGENNYRAPYHIIVAAINLQGSNERTRKNLKSDHFIFSKYYVGSNATGYVRTDKFRHGQSRLARAMAISAAAVGSGMGETTFFAQSFFTTLFNIRLGYWMENPWHYNPESKKEPDSLNTFWPSYLLTELMGWSNAKRKLVNVSDGGHTGDNLALLPLFQRKCEVIIVGDFEEDPEYKMISLAHAIRLAYVEHNITVEMDTTCIIPEIIDLDKASFCKQSVLHGLIYYPDGTKGHLFYVKSSLCKILPVGVFNYSNSNPAFPHQSTADQFFDDSQFEAHRGLGYHLSEKLNELMEEKKVFAS